MIRTMMLVILSLISISSFARTDMEMEAREFDRDRREARLAAEKAAQVAAVQDIRYMRELLNNAAQNDPTLESVFRDLTAEQRAKIFQANEILYSALVGARLRGAKQ